LLFYAVFIYRTAFSIQGETYFTLVDDAMISMRYAKNFSNGYGLVWNIGKPPVEGFTNLGWTVYMAILHASIIPISESKISLLVMITSVLLLFGNAILSFKLSKIIAPDSMIAPLIATTITLFYYPLVFWSLRGMEVGFATFLIYLSVLLAINPSKPVNARRALLLGLVMALAVVIRFDLVLQITILLVYSLYEYIIKRKANVLPISPILLLYWMGIIGVFLFQYFYFGSIVPNTYYLKVEDVSLYERIIVGIQVFVEYATRDFIGPLILIIAGVLYYRDLRIKENVLLVALFLIQCIYSIYVGGDYAEPLYSPQVDAANRFITQGMPSVIILFSIVIERFVHSLGLTIDFRNNQSRRLSKALVIGISLATLVLISGEPWFKWGVHNAPLLDADIWRAKLGVHIKNNTDESVIIATHASGQIPYYSNRQTIDLLGKNDIVVAKGSPATSFRPGHNKWDYEYSIMILRPDLIADEGGYLAKYLAEKPGYYRLENGVWIRNDTISINIEGLSRSYR